MNGNPTGAEPQNRNDLFRQIVENSALGLVLTDVHGTIVYANPRQCEASGFGSAELVGQNARIFQSGRTPVATYEKLWATVLAGGIWQGDLLNRRKSGELVWDNLHISPIWGDDGRICHFLAVTETVATEASTPHFGGRRATLDGLTGLPNRSSLIERLGQLISRTHTAAGGFAVMLLDLDNFRACNEAHGHIVADQVLQQVVARLVGSIRGDDLLARTGSDEFVLVVNGMIDRDVCMAKAAGILASIAQPIPVGGLTVNVTASLGITRYPEDASDAESLLRHAEFASAEARRAGGGRCSCHAAERPARAAGPDDFTAELHRAIDNGELRLHFQPQLSLVSGEMVGAEALVRWQHPERGLIAPGAFIPLAEESGLIITIGEWVLGEACRQARAWQAARLPALRISVNLSARHFRVNDLPDTVAGILADCGLEARYLELELTESAMMQDAAKAVQIVDRLKRLGLRISLDDFGTGYSSLAYLSRFAIDCLKIDPSFVRDITSNPVNASIATAMIAMAHKLGKRVTAEGVETKAQMQFLRRHDCDEMQGFYFSRAVPAEALMELLRTGKRLGFQSDAAAEPQTTLLLVDDEANILNALRRLFRREGYHILTAGGGAEALEILAVHPVQVIVSDQRMPGMSGVELLSKVKELYPETVRIVLSGYSEISTVTDAINKGAIWKYITKPWDDDALVKEIRAAFRLVRSQ